MRRVLTSACIRLLAGHHAEPVALSCLQMRCMSATAQSSGSPLQSFRQILEPDVYDPHEQLLAKNFGTAKQGIGHYYKPEDWNKDFKQALADRADLFWHRFDAYVDCYRSIQRFTRGRMLDEAVTVFESVSRVLASHQSRKFEAVKDLIVPNVYERMLLESKGLEAHKNCLVHWELVSLEARVVDAAVEQVIPLKLFKMRPSKLSVAQFTVQFRSQQRFWITKADTGEVISGSPTEVMHCQDYWVFERPFYKSWFIRKPGPRGARWRLVEMLDTEKVLNPTEEIKQEIAAAATDRSMKTTLWVALPLTLAFALYSLM